MISTQIVLRIHSTMSKLNNEYSALQIIIVTKSISTAKSLIGRPEVSVVCVFK